MSVTPEIQAYMDWLERRIEICLEDPDLQREHWAFCMSLKKLKETLEIDS